MSKDEVELPLFPLHTVLFPGGRLPLRIFEARYTDMVSRCLKENIGFGVCLIGEGDEVGSATMHAVGTSALIVDWHSGEDGLLGIVVQGEQRFEIRSSRRQKDGLYLGMVHFHPPEPEATVPRIRQPLATLLEKIIAEVGADYLDDEPAYNDAHWVGYRLAELLPLALAQRQYLLELTDPVRRLEILDPLVASLAAE
jgi:Lon protease-like protein